MQINPEIYRGYDIRGLVKKDLTPEVVRILGKAYATFLYQRQIREAVVGMDIRRSSPELHQAFTEALLESGITVHDIGLTLTQIMYYAQYHFRSKGGAIITASHNPIEYNGLKLAVGFSDTMITEEIQELRSIAERGEFKTYGQRGEYGKHNVFPAYKDDLLKRIGTVKLPFTIVVDAISATPGAFLPDILRGAGCQVIEKNTTPDPSFPLGTPDPTEQHHMDRLAEDVRDEKADLGVMYDSDGDRIGFVDQDGHPIWNDVLLALFSKDILDFLPGSPIVFNVLCSKATKDVIVASGGRPVMWLTGHSFIKAKVKESRAPFGGELSGHFFFMDNFYGHDDGAFATLRLLSYLHRHHTSLKKAVAELPRYVSSPEIKLGLPDKIKFQVITNEIAPTIKKLYPDAEYVEIDGVRMDTEDIMAVVRASQNGPYITIKFEGRTQEQYEQLKQQIKKILKENPKVDWSYGVNVAALN